VAFVDPGLVDRKEGGRGEIIDHHPNDKSIGMLLSAGGRVREDREETGDDGQMREAEYESCFDRGESMQRGSNHRRK
jgi:hypothetical protein